MGLPAVDYAVSRSDDMGFGIGAAQGFGSSIRGWMSHRNLRNPGTPTAGRSSLSARGRIWVLADGKPRALDVRTGLTDGTATELSGGGIEEGMEVIVGMAQAARSGSGQPRMRLF